MLKTFKYTSLCVILIWYLCLFKPPTLRTPMFVGFDKFTHISMYLGTCSVFWFEYLRSSLHFSKFKLLIIAVIAPILMSGIIELCQEYLTTYRSAEWFDFLANSIGVILALTGTIIYRHFKKRM